MGEIVAEMASSHVFALAGPERRDALRKTKVLLVIGNGQNETYTNRNLPEFAVYMVPKANLLEPYTVVSWAWTWPAGR